MCVMSQAKDGVRLYSTVTMTGVCFVSAAGAAGRLQVWQQVPYGDFVIRVIG